MVRESALICNEDKDTTESLGHHPGSNQSNAVTLLQRQARLSLTFRKIRQTPCDCKYPGNCDSQNYGLQLLKHNRNLSGCSNDQSNCLPQSEDAVSLEKEYVHNVYEDIAEHFSGTRHSPWPKIAEFLKEQPSGSLVADVGCGNGKYLGINDQLFMFGSDRSQNLASICKERGYSIIVCDILSLPYRYSKYTSAIYLTFISTRQPQSTLNLS